MLKGYWTEACNSTFPCTMMSKLISPHQDWKSRNSRGCGLRRTTPIAWEQTPVQCNDSGPKLMLVVRPRGKRGWQTVRQGPLLGLQGNLVWMTVRTLLIHPRCCRHRSRHHYREEGNVGLKSPLPTHYYFSVNITLDQDIIRWLVLEGRVHGIKCWTSFMKESI